MTHNIKPHLAKFLAKTPNHIFSEKLDRMVFYVMERKRWFHRGYAITPRTDDIKRIRRTISEVYVYHGTMSYHKTISYMWSKIK